MINAQPYFPAKGHVFNDSLIPRIDVLIDDDSLDVMYDDLYTDHEYPATFIFNNGTVSDTLENTGIRIRGNTSQTSQKKSFKIDFNEFVPGRKFYGLEKLHLNGEHNDPCITRSRLYWDILESIHVPGSRANHVDLYINGIFFGLYVNVEVVDENFLHSRFGNNYGNLYKCLYPADLHYINSNPEGYKLMVNDRRVYELETNQDDDDYSDISTFISMLHFAPDSAFATELEKQFNVNSFLRAYALDVASGNWDDYAYNINNYYLYHNPETGKFEYIVYDTDNTFGIDWFGVDWGTKDIFSWYNGSVDPVLVERIFSVPEYVSRLTFFTAQLQSGLFDTLHIFPKIDSILAMIQASAEQDSFRTLDYGWDYDDFQDSYIEEVGFHVKYGLKPFFTTRHDATENQLQPNDVIPVISNVNHLPRVVHPNDSVFITAWIEDELIPSSTQVSYKINSGSLSIISMFDDGIHQDGMAGDEIYGAAIIAPNIFFDTIYYFVTAADVNAQAGREPREGFNSVIINPVSHLVFNELMASNSSAVADEYGEFDDWLEIYNPDSFPVFLGDKFLSDEAGNMDKWRLPPVQIPANGFILVWCDAQSFQGEFHSDFKLGSGGEQVMMYEQTGLKSQLLDSLAFSQQTTNVSVGCFPDGILPVIVMQSPTPGYSNLNTGILSFGNNQFGVEIFPNPFHDNLRIDISVEEIETLSFEIMSVAGVKIFTLKTDELHPGKYSYSVPENNLAGLTAGIYLIRVSGLKDHSTFNFIQKIVRN